MLQCNISTAKYNLHIQHSFYSTALFVPDKFLLGQQNNAALILIQPIDISSVVNCIHENLVKMMLKYNMKISFM
jgi:hypothetical protein